MAEEFVRLCRADEQRRYVASQRRGRIDPNPHQIDAVVFALQRIPEGGCILADEVGLGKTIEAGLVIAQVLAEGMRRILLIVPKSLLGQWQTELYSLFGIEAHEGRADPESFAGDGVFLVHREFAGGDRGSSILRTVDPFDLVVIDEAHEVFAGIYKRFDKDGNYDPDSDQAQTADRVRHLLKLTGTPVLLLTATPIQNSLAELWGLVQYVEPSGLLFGKLPTFREIFSENKGRSLIPDQAHELRRRLRSVLQRTLRRQAQEFLEVPFVERQAKLIEYSMSPEEKELYDDVTAWLMDPYLCSFSGNNRQLLLIGFHRRLASSRAALSSSLEKVAERLRQELAGRGIESANEIAIELAGDLEEELDPEESALDDSTKPRSEERLRAELELVEGFIQRAQGILRESKAECLLDALNVIRERGATGEGSGKVVIFTESIKTQDSLFDLLCTNGFEPKDVTRFRGHNDGPRTLEAFERWEKEVGAAIPSGNRPSRQVAIRLALVHEFRKHSKVFISTEAGAKGLNLQFCETLINYDLPWNPQRIEQRIGRVHRYGQQRGVTILNLVDRGNEAQKLTIDILCTKFDLFGKVLDASDVVLHAPSPGLPEPFVSGIGIDFEVHLRRIYEQARTVDQIAVGLRVLRESMDEKRKEFDSEQARAAQLIETRLDDSVRQVFRKYREALPAGLEQLDRELDDLVGAFLSAIGADYERAESSGRIAYRISPFHSLPDAYRDGGTFLIGHAREMSEGEPLHPGHLLVRAAVEEARRATSLPFAVELVANGEKMPECLASLVGRRGRLVVTKVAYKSFEPVEHLLKTVLLEDDDTPLDRQKVEALLALLPRDVAQSQDQPVIDERLLGDAIEEAVLLDQSATTVVDENRFERKLEQLDRYLDDQILVLTRKRAGVERRLDEAERRRDRAAIPSSQVRDEQAIQSAQGELLRIEGRIESLQRGEDPDYQLWRTRLYERRFRQPTVERLLQVDFQVIEGGDPC